jgi:colanic acid/amylovoran biosynthesis glycosyltransferase
MDMTIAYLANEFPSPVEPYVAEEIVELERRGISVVACSARRSRSGEISPRSRMPDVLLMPLKADIAWHAAWLCIPAWSRLRPIVSRVLFHGSEGPVQRLKALAHTFLGACYAIQLRERKVEHIHVHHGYFGSWIAMTASRLLGINYSLTLHGSDLLLNASYLDVKLEFCKFCVTVSEYNRRHILAHYPALAREKVIVSRMGVEIPEREPRDASGPGSGDSLKLLAVGRLHPVKDHEFLIKACARLAAENLKFECSIAGEGPEHRKLERLIAKLGLAQHVHLLGHVDRLRMGALYERADVVVLTSRSEGIPLVLMEAMSHGKIVLAPAITGIPELVIAGKTGFLYERGSMNDFLDQLRFIRSLMVYATAHDFGEGSVKSRRLDWVRHAARLHVTQNFNRSKNLESFADLFLNQIAPHRENSSDENLVLQQI